MHHINPFQCSMFMFMRNSSRRRDVPTKLRNILSVFTHFFLRSLAGSLSLSAFTSVTYSNRGQIDKCKHTYNRHYSAHPYSMHTMSKKKKLVTIRYFFFSSLALPRSLFIIAKCTFTILLGVFIFSSLIFVGFCCWCFCFRFGLVWLFQMNATMANSQIVIETISSPTH